MKLRYVLLAALACSTAMVACQGSSRVRPGTPTARLGTTPVASGSMPRTSAGSASFAYAKPDGTIWLMRADGNERELIATPLDSRASDAAARVVWSPDGRSLAYQSVDGKLKLLDVDAGTETVLDDADPRGDLLPWQSWARSGTIAYLKPVAAHVYDLWVVTPLAVPRRIAADAAGGFWSPDGERFALQRRAKDPSVRGVALSIYDIVSGSEEPIAENGEFLGWSPDSRLVAYFRDPDGGSATFGEIDVRDVATGREINLGTFSSDEGPRWAPDASTETFMNVRIDPTTGSTQQLWPRSGTALVGQRSVLLGWSPDVRRVVLVRESAARRDLVIRDVGTGLETVIHSSVAEIAHVLWPGFRGIWSPDSRYFAFSSADAPDPRNPNAFVSNAYVTDAASGATREITGSPAPFTLPAAADLIIGSFAPGGDALMLRAPFVDEIWVAQADGSHARQVATGTVVVGWDGSPWRHRG